MPEDVDLEFVLSTLKPYEAAELISDLCMDVVDRLEPEDGLLRRVASVLGETGVLTGEFGHVEAEREQHTRLRRFVDNRRPEVQALAMEHMRTIEKSMAWEHRHAKQGVEQMRRDWVANEVRLEAAPRRLTHLTDYLPAAPFWMRSADWDNRRYTSSRLRTSPLLLSR